MEYYSNFLWEKGKEDCSRVSLVLQHVQIRKKQVLLACVCESENLGEIGVTESGYFTEGLVEWFHRSFLKQCERNISDGEAEKLLEQEILRLETDIKRFTERKQRKEALHYWGILLWENRFCIFHKGSCEGYLINKRFQKKHMRRLGISVRDGEAGQAGRQREWLSGYIQRGVGILLCTAGFIRCLESEEVVEVLDLEGDMSEQRLGKRLQELRQENVRRGEAESVGAIYLHT